MNAAARPFHIARSVRLLYAFGVAREFTPMLAVWVVYLTDFRHLSLTQVGIMEGLFWAVKLALEIPSGAFADHFGRKATFAWGIALEAIGTAIFAFSGDFALLALSYVVWSAGLAFRSGNDEAYMYDALAAGERESEYTDRIGMYWALNTGSTLAGGLLGGVLAAVTDLQIAVLAALIPFLIALPLLAFIDEPPRAAHERRLGLATTLREGLAAIRRSGDIRSILLVEVGLTGVFPAFFLLSQPYLDAHGVSVALFGVLAIPVHLARSGAGLVSGRVTRRIGLPALLVLALGGSVAGLLVLALVDHVAAYAGLALAMGGVSVALPAIGAYVNDRTDSNVRATVLSIAPMGTSLMIGAMSTMAGTLAAGSIRLAFGVLALSILVFAGANLLAWLGASRTSVAPVAEPVEA